MFPSRFFRRLGADLLDVADAMLCPIDEDACRGPVDERDPVRASLDAHPHRTPVRIERARRAGTSPARAQHCISPLPERAPRRLAPAATR